MAFWHRDFKYHGLKNMPEKMRKILAVTIVMGSLFIIASLLSSATSTDVSEKESDNNIFSILRNFIANIFKFNDKSNDQKLENEVEKSD